MPVRRRLGQGPARFARDVLRHVRSNGADGWHRIDEMTGYDGAGIRPDEWRLPDQHLVENAAERVEIAAVVHVLFAVGLLGAHVSRRPHGQAGLRDTVTTGRGHGQCNAEVGDDRVTGL